MLNYRENNRLLWKYGGRRGKDRKMTGYMHTEEKKEDGRVERDKQADR